MLTIHSTGKVSLIVQFITGAIDIYMIAKPVTEGMNFVKQLLWIETVVQVIEASFYIWLITSLNQKNVTRVRYYDWVITTPTMLFTYMMYLTYIHKKTEATLYDTAIKNITDIIVVLVLNTFMLGFGYLAEIGKLSTNVGVTLGFIPFFSMFVWIYMVFAQYSFMGRMTFWYFSSIWGLYGIAALLPYVYKNIIYNVLDIFSKNFFGLFLAYILWNSTNP